MVSRPARGRRRGWLATSCVAVAVCLSLAGVAAARPIAVSPPNEDVALPDVEMTGTAEFMLGWQSPDALIDVAEGSANEPLNPPVAIRHFGDGSSDLSSLAINPAGIRVVVWLQPARRDRPNVNLAVWAAARTRGGRWRSHRVGGRVARA